MSKKSEKIYDGITHIDDTIIEDVQAADAGRARIREIRPRKWWMSAVAAVLVAAIALGVFLRPGGNTNSGTMSAYALAEPEYPEMPAYPTDLNDKNYHDRYIEWWNAVKDQLNHSVPDTLPAFSENIARQYLQNAGTDNRVVSPVNLYLSLAMLAEVTDSESRAQILSLLGTDSISTLRKDAANLWNASYRDDGASASILANSIWLNDRVGFTQKTLDTLADKYYASTYRGRMGSEELDQALRDWINKQTGDLLDDQTKNLRMDADTIMALVSTIYFKAAWDDEFYEQATDTAVFHSPKGDVDCDMMHGSADMYYWGEKFSAVSRRLQSEMGNMYFILPDEGVSIDELLADPEALRFIGGREDWENTSRPYIHLSLPKFDVVSDLDLIGGLKELGVTDVFDSGVSDFSPLTDEKKDLYISNAEHAARVAVDEEGVVAAAYTVYFLAEGAALIGDQIDFVLDRPFLFVIAGSADQTLFVGVVNQP